MFLEHGREKRAFGAHGGTFVSYTRSRGRRKHSNTGPYVELCLSHQLVILSVLGTWTMCQCALKLQAKHIIGLDHMECT